MKAPLTEENVMSWLKKVKDPEIPTISLIDLGVITKITVDKTKVRIDMTPTFAGCPAMDIMKSEVEKVLNDHGVEDFEVHMNFDRQWSSNQITDKGRKAIKKHGLAPPPKHNLIVDLSILQHVACPYCESTNTELKSPFGPTLCRSIHYCNDCRQAFEQFKPV